MSGTRVSGATLERVDTTTTVATTAVEEGERPYAWVLPALPAEAERVVVALEQRQRERSRGTWWRRAAAARLRPLDREMAAVRELRELATAVLDRRGGNRYGTVVPVSEVLLLLADRAGWSELLTLAGVDRQDG